MGADREAGSGAKKPLAAFVKCVVDAPRDQQTEMMTAFDLREKLSETYRSGYRFPRIGERDGDGE